MFRLRTWLISGRSWREMCEKEKGKVHYPLHRLGNRLFRLSSLAHQTFVCTRFILFRSKKKRKIDGKMKKKARVKWWKKRKPKVLIDKTWRRNRREGFAPQMMAQFSRFNSRESTSESESFALELTWKICVHQRGRRQRKRNYVVLSKQISFSHFPQIHAQTRLRCCLNGMCQLNRNWQRGDGASMRGGGCESKMKLKPKMFAW